MTEDRAIAISIQHLTKTYRLSGGDNNPRFDGELFYAIKDITFDVYKGELIGIIGNNGSGKSTLLKVLSQITKPSYGEARFYGTVTSILDIGTNFHPDLTGRENVSMHQHITGQSKEAIPLLENAILAFSEIGGFFDQPVKTYSSGMFLRLAFSVAFHLSSDILLLDEVLSVGDEGFRLKCNEFIHKLAQQGRTILFVSHNREEILALSNKCLWLENGKIKRFDHTPSVLSEYFSSHRDNYDQKKHIIDPEHSLTQDQFEKDGTVHIVWNEKDAPGNEILAIRELSISAINGLGVLVNTEPVLIKFVVHKKKAGIEIGAFFYIQDIFYQPILLGHFLNNTADVNISKPLKDQTGVFEIACVLPANFLMPGKYYLFPRFGMEREEWNLNSEEAFRFTDKLNFTIHPSPTYVDFIGDISKGAVRPPLQWNIQQIKQN